MNALEDTREIVTSTSAPDTLQDSGLGRGRFIAGYVDDLFYKCPDVEIASIRIHLDDDGIVTVTGRRGSLAAPPIECPQCHQPIGRPHTEFCTLAPGRVWDGVIKAADHPTDWSARIVAGHHLVHSEAFIDQDDPRSQLARGGDGAHAGELED